MNTLNVRNGFRTEIAMDQDHLLHVIVTYPAARKPYDRPDVPRSETVGMLKAAVLNAFGLTEDPSAGGTTYRLYHGTQALDDLSQALGTVAGHANALSEAVSADPEAIITDEHVRTAPEDKRLWLSQQVGKKVCSVTPAAISRQLTTEPQRFGFAPSVPFVACYSSCMVVTELVRYIMTGSTLPKPRWQMNVLWGPHRGVDYPEQRHPNCTCVSRVKNIELVRSARR
jgi:hypothetical protein